MLPNFNQHSFTKQTKVLLFIIYFWLVGLETPVGLWRLLRKGSRVGEAVVLKNLFLRKRKSVRKNESDVRCRRALGM